MSNRLYLNDTEVKIIWKTTGKLGETGLVKDYNERADEYFIVSTEYNILGNPKWGRWYCPTEFTPVAPPSGIVQIAATKYGIINPHDISRILGLNDNYVGMYKNSRCNHKWKGTKLVFNTVYDCELCGIKKEVYDKEQSEMF